MKEKSKSEAFAVMGWRRGQPERSQTLELLARGEVSVGQSCLQPLPGLVPADLRELGEAKAQRENAKCLCSDSLIAFDSRASTSPSQAILGFNGPISSWHRKPSLKTALLFSLRCKGLTFRETRLQFRLPPYGQFGFSNKDTLRRQTRCMEKSSFLLK